MEHETLTCPFCGAPYREVIPSGTVQLKCKYCRGTILVPPYFGGAVIRCPNHPEVIAVGLCNDCSQNYCDNCLRLFKVQEGTLHLCPSCFAQRETKKAASFLLSGVVALLMGFMFISIAPSSEGALIVVLYMGIFVLPLLGWGTYRMLHLPKGLTLKETRLATQREIEFQRSLGSQASTSELYSQMLLENMRDYGPQAGVAALERRIDYYMQTGMTRREAVRKLAEEKGY